MELSSLGLNKREVIIYSPNMYALKGVSSLLNRIVGVTLVICTDMSEVINQCNAQTAVVIYQFIDDSVMTGTIRSMHAVSIKHPGVVQLVISDKLNDLFGYLSKVIPYVFVSRADLPVLDLMRIVNDACSKSFCLQAKYTMKRMLMDRKLFFLTAKQRNIFQLLARQLTIDEVSKRLDMIPKTVRSHRYQALRRLGVSDTRSQKYFYQLLDEILAFPVLDATICGGNAFHSAR